MSLKSFLNFHIADSMLAMHLLIITEEEPCFQRHMRMTDDFTNFAAGK